MANQDSDYNIIEQNRLTKWRSESSLKVLVLKFPKDNMTTAAQKLDLLDKV